MFVVHSLPIAIMFCVVTMLGWGSWANTQKLAGKEKWPFQLFYWDYAIGVFLFSLLFAHTLGSFGSSGPAVRENTHGLALLTFRLPYYLAVSAVYGILAWRAGSVLPGLALHSIGDAAGNVVA